MPDKPVTVAAYAAGASLAAITLFYVFGPTFFIDGENSYNTSDERKRGIVGLSNPANDCFINSVLQALAGLGDLRLYLIRELHRRRLEGPAVHESLPADFKEGEKPDKIIDLQRGSVTQAMKDMLDGLNERPIYKKTITAKPLIVALEKAFRTKISRNQQDAQEFYQILAERLCDEYHAAEKARRRQAPPDTVLVEEAEKSPRMSSQEDVAPIANGAIEKPDVFAAKDEGFPFEGKLESQIQCQHCGFKYKPTSSNFVSLTLNVPQKNSTTLDNCFDILLMTEDIEDFKCDKCRLRHALEWKTEQLRRAKSEKEQADLRGDIDKIEEALSTDPEKAPEGVRLPAADTAPKRKIKRHLKISHFPKIVAIHLSRSVFDPRSYSTKNTAKVAYPERLRLGGLLEVKWYRLLGIVCHKGSHNSGHYESFRRNHLYAPFSTPGTFSAYAAASRNGTVVSSANPSPNIAASSVDASPALSRSPEATPTISSVSLSPGVSRPTSQEQHLKPPAPSTSRPSSREGVVKDNSSDTQSRKIDPSTKFRRKKKSNDRWWRISDDKVKEARTSEVLGMQKEVYLLFYEMERPGDDDAMS